jgi:hypothetical protein
LFWFRAVNVKRLRVGIPYLPSGERQPTSFSSFA